MAFMALTMGTVPAFAKPRPDKQTLYEEVDLLAEAMTVIQSDYVEEVEPKRLIYGALKGLVESLDRHSQFLDPNAFAEIKVETQGEFGGVGLEITVSKDGTLTVITPMDDTPAALSGLKPNDKIIKIDYQSTRGISLHEAVKRLRGRPGTQVLLGIYRESDSRVFDVTLKRERIEIRSVKEARILEDRIGFVRITEFQDNTGRDLRKALEILEEGGLDGLILDLRNNPGGLLDVAVEVAGLFLPKGEKILSTKGRAKSQNLEFVCKEEHPHLTFPIVILVNNGSASASEIVAGALQDHRRAILMGTKTFGKGSVQVLIPLRDGSALRLTTSIYYTPSGRAIHGQGLDPDVPAEEASVVSAGGDPLVRRSLDLIKGLKVYKGRDGPASGAP